MERPKPTTTVVTKITIETEGTPDELLEYLSEKAFKHFTGNPEVSFAGIGFSIYGPNVGSRWTDAKTNGLQELTNVFVNSLTTGERLTASNSATGINLTSEPPQHPIHKLYKDVTLETKISQAFRQAFGTDLLVHRAAGASVPLYIGETPPYERLSMEFAHAVQEFPSLHDQGDGMRSFVGVLLRVLASDYPVMIIDEPEAFLHPPQARLLGKMLAKDLPEEKQLFLATHSEDFLKGLLDAAPKSIKVIRIQRDGKLNRVKVLESADINAIWKDSLLRHSNVLNGLFHSRVVICESDSDSRFYSAVLDAVTESNEILPDILFIHCGGKHRIPTAVDALTKLDVPITVVTDFDVLNDIKPLRDIYESLGGNWTDIEKDWHIVKTAVDTKKPELSTDDVKSEIAALLDGVADAVVPKDVVTKIKAVVGKTSAWAIAKETGKSFIPSGEATSAYVRLHVRLKLLGLLIVQTGEAESFVKSVGNHGPKWVAEVLETKDLKNDPELDAARRFVRTFLGEV